MKRLFCQGIQKLRGARGETIAEVLLSLLIASVAMLLLAGLIASSTRMIKNSREKLEKYYDQNRALSLLEDSGGVSTADATLNLTFDEETDPRLSIPVTLYQNSEAPQRKPVVAYKLEGSAP